jgi:hypothetical protein
MVNEVVHKLEIGVNLGKSSSKSTHWATERFETSGGAS